jgi:hypothetical protein
LKSILGKKSLFFNFLEVYSVELLIAYDLNNFIPSNDLSNLGVCIEVKLMSVILRYFTDTNFDN